MTAVSALHSESERALVWRECLNVEHALRQALCMWADAIVRSLQQRIALRSWATRCASHSHRDYPACAQTPAHL
jgi:hypothetical protein